MQQRIALDTLGALQAYGFRLCSDGCDACAGRHRRDARLGENPARHAVL